MRTHQPTFAEFFAGIGLVRLGLERAGWRVAFANDIDDKKFRQYDAHFGDAHEHFRLGDVHALDAVDMPTVDLATASFPCTDLSVAGGRRGLNSGESSAFWGFHRLLVRMGDRRPRLVMLENVVGFLTSHGGADFAQAMRALSDLGYSVDPFVMDARWFVPQSRPRLFVVGELGGPRNADCSESRTRPGQLTRFIREHPEIAWGLRALPEPPMRSSNSLRDILDELPADDAAWWSPDRVAYLYGQMSAKHQSWVLQHVDRGAWSHGTVFRRVRVQADGTKRSMGELRVDGVAGCLRTPKGGSGRQILFQTGYGEMRARLLTPHECARLMGADGFRVTGSLNDALFGFGDAVCATVIEWIATHRLNHPAQRIHEST
ncbi:MAG TPA: DNA (cytosine-5-)-methyltransferase [Phycisphaerales bacterium]|nr:DNA (cytosine-5-)-methyltransferase [Phycisphaerales bacterium]